ncbi:hypothetical protein L596_021314 [Steinernema carpocapsae]|uniref:Uncharacterized protein n=1 Tax=Steinernema carpocapsae TaxID=34508 RepID=A0A4U5MID7_STECR|nr:hypothetical protein L596_021314 [Steinernema carpocapsae]
MPKRPLKQFAPIFTYSTKQNESKNKETGARRRTRSQGLRVRARTEHFKQCTLAFLNGLNVTVRIELGDELVSPFVFQEGS